MYYKTDDKLRLERQNNKPQHIQMVENFANQKAQPKARVIKLLIIVVLLLLIAYLVYSENGIKKTRNGNSRK